jgi:hypothetical protein
VIGAKNSVHLSPCFELLCAELAYKNSGKSREGVLISTVRACLMPLVGESKCAGKSGAELSMTHFLISCERPGLQLERVRRGAEILMTHFLRHLISREELGLHMLSCE